MICSSLFSNLLSCLKNVTCGVVTTSSDIFGKKYPDFAETKAEVVFRIPVFARNWEKSILAKNGYPDGDKKMSRGLKLRFFLILKIGKFFQFL